MSNKTIIRPKCISRYPTHFKQIVQPLKEPILWIIQTLTILNCIIFRPYICFDLYLTKTTKILFRISSADQIGKIIESRQYVLKIIYYKSTDHLVKQAPMEFPLIHSLMLSQFIIYSIIVILVSTIFRYSSECVEYKRIWVVDMMVCVCVWVWICFLLFNFFFLKSIIT